MRIVRITDRIALDADRIIGITEYSYKSAEGQVSTCAIDMADGGRQVRYEVPLSLSEILGILNAEPEPTAPPGVEYTTTVEGEVHIDAEGMQLRDRRSHWQFPV